MSVPPPPSSEFLHTLLFNLLPPRLPVPPELLSSDIKTRHLYLPPTASSPDAYICQRAATDRDIVDRLTAIDEEWEQAGRDEVPRASLHDRIQQLDDDLEYQQKDEQTVLCRFEAKPPRGRPGVEVVLIHEGESAGWLLFDTGLDAPGPDGWFRSPSEAHAAYLDAHTERTQKNPYPEHLDGDEDDDEWKGNGNAGDPRGTADDFWGGYSDDEKGAKSTKVHRAPAAAKPPSVPSIVAPPPAHPSRHGSGIEDTTDTYWSSYATVEDGLRASNPPSRVPSVTDFGGFTAIGRGDGGDSRRSGYWGTGGETPMVWSPEPEPASRSVGESLRQDEQPTVDLNSSTESLVGIKQKTTGRLQFNDREKALHTTLTGLYEMYVRQGDVAELGDEFRNVLRGF